jgi:hypothetical protein
MTVWTVRWISALTPLLVTGLIAAPDCVICPRNLDFNPGVRNWRYASRHTNDEIFTWMHRGMLGMASLGFYPRKPVDRPGASGWNRENRI